MIRLTGRGTDWTSTHPAGAGIDQPFYARMLRLRNIHPGGLLCFLFFEFTIGLALLLALAELVPWTAIPVLPVTVAALVKVNDLIVGASARSQPRRSFTVRPVYATAGGYPSIVRALEAAPARPGLYGTPLALPSGRSGHSGPSSLYGTPLALPPARGVATVDGPPSVFRPSSTVYGSAAAGTSGVPATRAPAGQRHGGRHARPSGASHHTPHR